MLRSVVCLCSVCLLCSCCTAGNGLLFLLVVLVGGGIGTILALRVEMTSMPQLVALLHSFVGVAAVLVGLCNALAPAAKSASEEESLTIHRIEIFLGIWIGCITFTGSLVAAGKLQGTVSSSALQLKGRHVINSVLVIISIALAVVYVPSHGTQGMIYLYIMLVISGIIGLHLVLSIGGAGEKRGNNQAAEKKGFDSGSRSCDLTACELCVC